MALGEEAEDAELERLARRADGELEVLHDAVDDLGRGARDDRPIRARGVRHADESSRSTSSSTAAATARFGAFATRPIAVGRDDHDLVLVRVEADVLPRDVVEDEEVGVLGAHASPARARARRLPRLPRTRRSPARADVPRRSPRGRPASARARPATGAVLRSFRLGRLGGAVVGDGCGHDDHVRVGAAQRLALEVGGSRRLHNGHTGWRRHREIRGEKRHVGASRSRLLGERDAHATRRAVPDVAHGVERLARAARRHQHALPAQRAVDRVRSASIRA